MLRNKKGVSPIIATVLLIAFAVALGALVMNWGRTYIEDTQTKVSLKTEETGTCQFDVNIKSVNIGQKPCFDSDLTDHSFYAIIENGNYELSGYKVTIFANNQIIEDDETIPIKKVESKIIKVPINTTIDPVKIDKVTIVPKVMVTGGKDFTYCTEGKIELDDVPSIKSCSG